MKDKGIDLKEIITENKEELRFKEFINKINNVFGEDYAALLFTCDRKIKNSIALFSSKFKNLSSTKIESLLIQSAMISKNNKYNYLFKNKINEDFCFFLFSEIERNMFFRKCLAREFIKDCNKNHVKLFVELKSIEEKINVIHNLNKIKTYESFLERQDKYYNCKIRKLKKENRH